MKQFEAGEDIKAGVMVCIKDDGKVYNVIFKPEHWFCEKCKTCEHFELETTGFTEGLQHTRTCNSPDKYTCEYKKKQKPKTFREFFKGRNGCTVNAKQVPIHYNSIVICLMETVTDYMDYIAGVEKPEPKDIEPSCAGCPVLTGGTEKNCNDCPRFSMPEPKDPEIDRLPKLVLDIDLRPLKEAIERQRKRISDAIAKMIKEFMPGGRGDPDCFCDDCGKKFNSDFSTICPDCCLAIKRSLEHENL